MTARTDMGCTDTVPSSEIFKFDVSVSQRTWQLSRAVLMTVQARAQAQAQVTDKVFCDSAQYQFLLFEVDYHENARVRVELQ